MFGPLLLRIRLGLTLVDSGRPIYLDLCPHAIADGVGTETPKGKLMYAPPADWSLAQRRALSNSLLVEYDNTWDAWTWKQNSGLIFNIDAMCANLRALNIGIVNHRSCQDAGLLVSRSPPPALRLPSSAVVRRHTHTTPSPC